MSRIASPVAVAVCLLTAAVFSGEKKVAAPPSKNPFAAKSERRLPATSAQRVAFRQETQELAERITAAAKRRNPERISESMRTALRRLEVANGGAPTVVWNEGGTMPIFVRGRRLQNTTLAGGARTVGTAEAQAWSFLQENRDLIRLADPTEELLRTRSERDALGAVHIRYAQRYQGIEVWGQELIVHLSPDGNIDGLNGRWVPTPFIADPAARTITESAARDRALEALGRSSGVERVVPMILPEGGSSRLTWMVQVRGRLDENWHLFVDATSGEIVKRYNHVMYDGPVVGSGTDIANQSRTLNVYQIGSTYYLIDASKAMHQPTTSTFPNEGKGVIYTLSAQNTDSVLFFVTAGSPTGFTSVKPAVSAAFYGSKVYDYFKTIHNRDAVDGKGSTITMVVNFGQNFNNAFWNGQMMVFGNGDGTQFSDLAAGIDVMAHEMTHGVVENTANLVYENQSGALNESFADVFGVLYEFYVRGAGGNWLMGEDVVTPAVGGDALRNMQDPGASNVAFSAQPGHMDQFQNLPNTTAGDHGGVHINSGIPNKAFYLFANSASVTKEEAGLVYYRALATYLTRNAQFIDARLAIIKAAEDLYGGPGNAKALAAAAAFDAVGIGSGSATPPPPTQNPVSGNSFVSMVGLSDGALYRSEAGGLNATFISGTPVSTRPSITDDGSTIFYVDGNSNLHHVSSTGTGDQQLSTSGVFNNVAISPNGRYLAVTSLFEEPLIYVFDLQNSAGDKVLQLYTPTYTQGVTTGAIQYPDRIDWASDNATIMYDALNAGVNANGDTVSYWDINFVRVSDVSIARLFPPQAQGVSIGNAVFASNSDNKIAFDYLVDGDSVRVLAVNLNTGTVGQVTNNVFSLGSPSFNSNDSKVYYHYISSNGVSVQSSVWVVDLASDGVTGTGNDASIVTGGIYPVSYTVGARTTDVESDVLTPATTQLEQNYPNPFNPETKIGYRIQETGAVRLSVYDILGREVAVLVNGDMPAGHHETIWNATAMPSGMYIYRLETRSVDGTHHTEARRMILMR